MRAYSDCMCRNRIKVEVDSFTNGIGSHTMAARSRELTAVSSKWTRRQPFQLEEGVRATEAVQIGALAVRENIQRLRALRLANRRG